MTHDLTLLRPFDAEAAKRGEPICHLNGEDRTYIAGPDAAGNIACLNDLNDTIQLARDKVYRMVPKGWCEGKPVYVGDTLYNTTGAGFDIDKSWGSNYKYMSWNPPTPKTKKVKFLAWETEYSDLRLVSNADTRPVPPTWKRVPSADQEHEVEIK